MQNTLQIDYSWKCSAFPKEIPSPLKDALEETAIRQISQAMLKGETSGTLDDNVHIDIPGVKTPADGFECEGEFQVHTEPLPTVILMRPGNGEPIEIGAVRTNASEEEIQELWDQWEEENPTPEADSEFTDWLLKQKNFHPGDGEAVLIQS